MGATNLGGKGTAGVATQLTGGSSLEGRDFIDTTYKITLDGDIDEIKFNAVRNSGTPSVIIKFWRLVSGTYELIGRTAEVEVTATGINTITVDPVISVQAGDYIGFFLDSSTSNQMQASSGAMKYTASSGGTDEGFITDQLATAFGLSLSSSPSIEVTGVATGSGVTLDTIKVANQKDVSTGTATLTISGNYVGEPVSLARRIEFADDNETIADWAICDAAPADLTYSFDEEIPASTRPIRALVRFTDTPALVGASNSFYIGDFVLIFGESTAAQLSTTGAGSPAAGCFQWNFDTEALTTSGTGLGQVWLGNTISAGTGHAVFIHNIGVGGTALLEENNAGNYIWNPSDPTSRSQYAGVINRYAKMGVIPCVFLVLGANDAFNNNTTGAAIEAGYSGLFAGLRGSTRADLPFITTLTGIYAGGGVDQAGYFENYLAQKSAYDADANVHYTTFYDVARADAVHPIAEGYAEMARRLANAALDRVFGINAPYAPPFISSVELTSDTQTTFNLTIPEGTDFTPTSAITSFQLFTDEYITPVTISSVVRSTATSILVTHDSAVIEYYRYNFGNDPVTTGLVKDNSARSIPLIQSQNATTVNVPPTANAGTNQTGTAAGAGFTLDSSASTGNGGATIVSRVWSQIAGDTVTLSSTTATSPTSTAPTTGSNQTLTFRVTVTDSNDLTAFDDVDIGVLAESVTPSATITTTDTVAGPNGLLPAEVGTYTISSGSTSTYVWRIVSGGGSLDTTTGDTVEYTAPIGSAATYTVLGVIPTSDGIARAEVLQQVRVSRTGTAGVVEGSNGLMTMM